MESIQTRRPIASGDVIRRSFRSRSGCVSRARIAVCITTMLSTGVAANLGGAVPVAAAAAPCSSVTITPSEATLPAATQDVPYQTILSVTGSDSAGYSFTTSGVVPEGLSLSDSGVLSGIPTGKPGIYAIDVVVVPRGCGSSTSAASSDDSVFTLDLNPSLAVQEEVASLPDSTGGTDPTLGGRISCAWVSGCNTSTSTFGQDKLGNPLTQWTQAYDGEVDWDTGCTSANGNHPSYIKNTHNGDVIGVYIDNEVDSNGSFTNREYLAQCASYDQNEQIVLVGISTDEAGTSVNGLGSLTAFGTMLEWYPFCNGNPDFSPDPPALDSIAEVGYVVQDTDYWPAKWLNTTCTSGPTQAQHQGEWNYAWKQVDDDLNGEQYNDLVANY